MVFLVFLIIVYKIIDKYINFNIISFKISININNNSIYYVYYIRQCYWFLSFLKKSKKTKTKINNPINIINNCIDYVYYINIFI